VSLTTLDLALAILACRGLTRPPDQPSANRLLNESGQVVVSPGAMHSWSFRDDQRDTACTDSAVCRMVDGPAGQPLGIGSAFLSTPAASDGKALVLEDYAGTRFDAITELLYATYRQSADSGRNLAIALQVNVDYDLTDQSVGYQGRLVYEPYQSAPGTVLDTTWESWDARAGKWWGTKASVWRGGVLVTNPCVQATPCTWAQLLTAFPNIGIHATYGAVMLEAGSGWSGFRGNVDALSIGINGATTTFDFELHGRTVPAQAPDSISSALWDSLTATANVMTDPPGMRGRWARNVMFITFQPSATLADRQAVIDLIQGEVVGGNTWPGGEREYIVRIPYATAPGDSISGPVLRTVRALRGHPSVLTVYPLSMDNLSKIHDFEVSAPGPILPPDTVPHALFDSLGTVMTSILGIAPGPYRRDIVVVRFEPETPLAARMAAIDSISGRVVGGDVDDNRQNGSYYVRISGGTFDALGNAVDILLRQPQFSNAYVWGLFIPDIQSYHRPPRVGSMPILGARRLSSAATPADAAIEAGHAAHARRTLRRDVPR
jgi:hypothetical protein